MIVTFSSEHVAPQANPTGRGSSVGTAEVYGFVGWIASSVGFVLYILWAYTPESLLHAHGVTYYPSRYWAVALPAWICVTVVFAFWLYEGLCMAGVRGPREESSLQDWATKRKEGVGMQSYFNQSTEMIPPLVDIPQELVSSILYGGLEPQDAENLYDKRRREQQVGAAVNT